MWCRENARGDDCDAVYGEDGNDLIHSDDSTGTLTYGYSFYGAAVDDNLYGGDVFV